MKCTHQIHYPTQTDTYLYKANNAFVFFGKWNFKITKVKVYMAEHSIHKNEKYALEFGLFHMPLYVNGIDIEF